LEIGNLQEDFSELQVNLLTELKAIRKSVDDLTTLISCLRTDVNRYVYLSWKKIVKNDFENLNKLFTYLNATVWNILDHYLLEYFVNRLGSKELKTSMETYSSKLKKFKEDTLVSDFISCWKDAQKKRDIPDFEKITIKYDKDKTTLADLDDYREKFAMEFFPSLIDCASVIHLGRIQTGCFVVTFQIPKKMALELQKMKIEKCQLFDDFKVIYISIGNIKVYDRSPGWIKSKFTITQ